MKNSHPNGHFAGDQKHLDHFLVHVERKLIAALLPLVPSWMSTAHLTLMTLLWAGLIVFFGFLAGKNINWLWGSNACILLQYMTDMLDGEVGRQRNTGLIKWGFYMDHFLDYVFLCAIVIGYSFLLPSSYSALILLHLALSGCFMVHVFLDFAITNDFKISVSQFGVSEIRILLIVLNVSLVFLGKPVFVKIFPFIVLSVFIGLVAMVCRFQRVYRSMDMAAKENKG
jgi:phosphatidylglycerophosphate synthase